MIIEKAREKILSEMLGRLPEDYDKSEGGLFYDNLAPISIEMENLFDKLKYFFNNSFAVTAEGIYLDYICKEVGILRKQATKSKGEVTIKGKVGVKVAVGTQVASDSYIYIITEEGTIGEEGTITLPIEAQDPGAVYNVTKGAITNFPVTIQGLKEVTNEKATVDGYDEESDEALRERYFFKVQNPITSGNTYHYIKWCKEVDGVGGVKVFPLWAGAGTVKCVIANKDNTVAPEELVKRVEVYVETVRPIGADVTIESAKEKAITITANIKMEENFVIEDVQANYIEAIEKYLREISFNAVYVSYAKLGCILLNTPGVIDYSNLLLNGGVVNVSLSEEEVPLLSTVELTPLQA